jgi:hypothetical protein
MFKVEEYNNETMTFYCDSSGQVTQLKFMGKLHPRVEGSSTFNQATMADYHGDYKSDELQASYSVITEDNQLKLVHTRFGKLKLQNVWSDDFRISGQSRWFPGSIAFTRDNAGRIDGFMLSDFRFIKSSTGQKQFPVQHK